MAHDYPEFALGAVPPLGGTRNDPVIVDRRLAEHEWLVFEAGTARRVRPHPDEGSAPDCASADGRPLRGLSPDE